jgi:hypothetical protein
MPYQVITLARIGTITPKAMLGTKLVTIANPGSVAQEFIAIVLAGSSEIV